MSLSRVVKPQKIFFAHSGGPQGGPGKGSYDLVGNLSSLLPKNCQVHCPLIDDPEAPTYEMWRQLFSRELSDRSGPLILVGHSLGGSVLLKYLSERKPRLEVSALFLVSTPHWGKGGWEVEDFALKQEFIPNLGDISNIYLYHSRDDDIVPFSHLSFYRDIFPNSIVRELSGHDHAFALGLPELVADISTNVG